VLWCTKAFSLGMLRKKTITTEGVLGLSVAYRDGRDNTFF
jgi:hypothetical protein